MLCGDTGIAHLATALDTPSVVVFGPTSPAHWGPPPERPRHAALWAGQAGDPHADRVHPGLLAIEVDDALRALRAITTPRGARQALANGVEAISARSSASDSKVTRAPARSSSSRE